VADSSFLDQVGGEVGKEAGRLAEDVAGVGLRVHHQLAQVELVLGAGEGDVEEAAFFFDQVGIVGIEHAAVGELAVDQPDEEDGLPLESLGLLFAKGQAVSSWPGRFLDATGMHGLGVVSPLD